MSSRKSTFPLPPAQHSSSSTNAIAPTTNISANTTTTGSTTASPFYAQRDALLNEIALAMEQVLQGINKLNRSLEGVIAVGNEFGAVEALWSQFEGVMAPSASGPPKKSGGKDDGDGDGEAGHGEDDES